MKNALGVLFLLIMTSCSSKNSYTTFDFTEQGNSMASYRMIQIKSTATKFNSNTTKPIFRGSPTEAGKLTDTFHLPKTGIYYLDLSTQVFPVIIEQGGLLKLKVVNSGRVPEIKFEGANSTINNFSFENTKCLIEQLLNQPMNRFDQQSEAQILAAVKKYRSASDKLFSEKAPPYPILLHNV